MAALAEDRASVVKAEWTALLARAAWARPAVLVLDNLDVLVGAELEVRAVRLLNRRAEVAQHADSSRQRQLAEHLRALLGAARSGGVAVLATAKSAAGVHPLLGASHVFGLRCSL